MRFTHQRPLKSRETGGTNWRRINSVETAAVGVSNQAAQTRYVLEARPHRIKNLFHPFKLYQIPQAYRDVPADDESWRTFIVRAGMVLESNATSTDGVADPYGETYPLTTFYEVVVPEDKEKFWFWLEIGSDAGVTTAIVRYGDDPTVSSYDDGYFSWDTTNPWGSFPKPDAAHVPIGYIDTHTDLAKRTAIVRQILTTDLAGGTGGSSLPVWL